MHVWRLPNGTHQEQRRGAAQALIKERRTRVPSLPQIHRFRFQECLDLVDRTGLAHRGHLPMRRLTGRFSCAHLRLDNPHPEDLQ